MITTLAEQPEFDFEHHLAPGKEFFGVRHLARLWDVSPKSVERLIEDGSLQAAPDLAPVASKHALRRVHRSVLVAFLNDRTNVAKMEALRLANRERCRHLKARRLAPTPASPSNSTATPANKNRKASELSSPL